MLSMMVGYTHNSSMLCRIWDPKWQNVKVQLEVIFNEWRDGHLWCQHDRNEIDTDIFGLPENIKYIKEIATRDEPLWEQDSLST